MLQHVKAYLFFCRRNSNNVRKKYSPKPTRLSDAYCFGITSRNFGNENEKVGCFVYFVVKFCLMKNRVKIDKHEGLTILAQYLTVFIPGVVC